jgi:hypothetical protein
MRHNGAHYLFCKGHHMIPDETRKLSHVRVIENINADDTRENVLAAACMMGFSHQVDRPECAATIDANIVEPQVARTQEEINAAIGEFHSLAWHEFHLCLKDKIEAGEEIVSPEKWKKALASATRVRAHFCTRPEALGPYDAFEWGMLNGKLSALRWVMGDDWDMLDT